MNSVVRYWNGRACQAPPELPLPATGAAGGRDPPGDPGGDAAALWRLIQSDFYDNQRVIVESLHAKRALRPDLDVARATDVLWTLNHPDVWLLLIGERGWAPEDWERWFADTACA